VSLVYKKIHSDTRVSLLFLRSDEMDVCGIFTMEFEGLRLNIKPMRRGLALRLHEWMDMKKIIENVDSEYYELGTALPCYLRESRQNQIGALECSECNPFKSLFF